jgi:hypothetical protein
LTTLLSSCLSQIGTSEIYLLGKVEQLDNTGKGRLQNKTMSIFLGSFYNHEIRTGYSAKASAKELKRDFEN